MWATDEEFADEVTYHELVNDFILDAGLIDVKKKLSNYTAEGAKVAKSGSSFRGLSNLNLGLLAGMAALISTGIYLAFSPGLFGNQNLSGNSQNHVAQKHTPITNPLDSMVLPELLAKGETKTGKGNNPENREGQKNKPESSVHVSEQLSKDQNSQTRGRKGNQELKPIKASKPYDEMGQGIIAKTEVKAPEGAGARADLSKELQDSLRRLVCQKVDIDGQVTTVPTCKGKINGKLKVRRETITGGEPPYRYDFSKNSSFQKSSIKEKLRSGSYKVRVKDSRGCVSLIASNAYIKAEQCGKRSFTFVPSREAKWAFPFKNDQPSGKIRIYNEKGEQVYRSEVNQGAPASWQGLNSNGQKCAMGLYRVVYNPENGKATIWLLTLIR